MHLDAEAAGIGIGRFAQGVHHVIALAGHHVMHGAFAELGAHAVVDGLGQTVGGTPLVTGKADIELFHILEHAPFDVVVNQHVLLLGGDETLGIGRVHGQDAGFEVTHVLDQRHLEIQAGLLLDRLTTSPNWNTSAAWR
jgi:hypothetical protein